MDKEKIYITADSGPLRGHGTTGGDTGPPKMVGADGNILENGAGAERKRGGGGRRNNNSPCRDGDNDAGDGVIIGFRNGIGGGGRRRRIHWEPVAPVERSGVERGGGGGVKSHTLTPDDQRYTGLSPKVAN